MRIGDPVLRGSFETELCARPFTASGSETLAPRIFLHNLVGTDHSCSRSGFSQRARKFVHVSTDEIPTRGAPSQSVLAL